MKVEYREEEYGCRKERLPCHECRRNIRMRNEDEGRKMAMIGEEILGGGMWV